MAVPVVECRQHPGGGHDRALALALPQIGQARHPGRVHACDPEQGFGLVDQQQHLAVLTCDGMLKPRQKLQRVFMPGQSKFNPACRQARLHIIQGKVQLFAEMGRRLRALHVPEERHIR